MSDPAIASDAEVEALRRGLDGVTPGPWECHTQTRYGDRSEVEEIEIWSDGLDVLIGTEVRRAHLDGGRRTMAHIARCSPDAIARLLARLTAAEQDTAKRIAEAVAAERAKVVELEGRLETAIRSHNRNAALLAAAQARAIALSARIATLTEGGSDHGE